MSSSTIILFTKISSLVLALSSAHLSPPKPFGAKVVPWFDKFPTTSGKGLLGNTTAIQRVLRDMDVKGNPCVDFYQFACGGYRKNKPIPMGYTANMFEPQEKVSQILMVFGNTIGNFLTMLPLLPCFIPVGVYVCTYRRQNLKIIV